MEWSQVLRDHCSLRNPCCGPHSKTQCLFVVIEMSELNNDKHPAFSEPSLCVLPNGFVYLRVRAFKKKDKLSLVLSSLCQPLMMQSKDRQYFMGLKLSVVLPPSSNGSRCLCVTEKTACVTWARVCVQCCVACRCDCIAVVQRLCFHLRKREKKSVLGEASKKRQPHTHTPTHTKKTLLNQISCSSNV